MERDYSAFPPLWIRAYSDLYDIPDRKVWGDFWLKETLINEFRRFGYPVDSSHPKIVLHLFGEPLSSVPEETYNILWIHSHPDWIVPHILKGYQKIYCISKRFLPKIADMGFKAEHLMIPTNMVYTSPQKKYDIVFVGNVKQNRIRKIVRDLGFPNFNIKIWGWGWENLIPDKWYGGSYYENALLNELYASSKIVLNDHHDDMRREGFINPRILDVLASGGFVVSDRVMGIDDILDDSVVMYDTPYDLREIIKRYIDDDSGRESHSRKGREIVSRFSYHSVCKKIIGHIESISDTLFL